MKRRLTAKRLLLSAAFGAAAVVATVLIRGVPWAPGTRSFGDPSDADWCNVILEPEIASEIGLDLADRIRVASKGAALLGTLKRNPVVAHAGDAANEFGQRTLERYGNEARVMLPPSARRKFERLFADGKLIHVGFWIEAKPKGARGPDPFFVTFGYFDKEKSRTGKKALSTYESDLRASYTWIPDELEAERLLEHPDESVRKAAETWFEKQDEGYEDPFEERRLERPIKRVRRVPRTRSMTRVPARKTPAGPTPSQRAAEEAKQRMEQSRQKRTAEREAFKERVRKHQEEVRARLKRAKKGG